MVLAGEDFTGLWDAALAVPAACDPVGTASSVLRDLVGAGLIELYESRDLAHSDPARLDSETGLAALLPGPQWDVPAAGENGPFIYFAATAAGVAWLHDHNWGHRG
jgi:hypothetical protein